jgi:hypothetical protein
MRKSLVLTHTLKPEPSEPREALTERQVTAWRKLSWQKSTQYAA